MVQANAVPLFEVLNKALDPELSRLLNEHGQAVDDYHALTQAEALFERYLGEPERSRRASLIHPHVRDWKADALKRVERLQLEIYSQHRQMRLPLPF